MQMPLDTEKMHGPTFGFLSDAHLKERESLIRKVAACSPSQLSALVIGPSVYEVFLDLPECKSLVTSMVYVKQKQLKFSSAAALRWTYNEIRKQKDDKDQFINKQVMRSFLTRFPLTILNNSVFKPLLLVAKGFLLSKLYEFKNGRALYNSVPRLRSEEHLPAVVNALGPMEQLTASYPHLARMKEEMVCNIMDFVLKYCLDWICEVSTLECDSKGKISYRLRPLTLVQYQQKGKEVLGKNLTKKRKRKHLATPDEVEADMKCKTDDGIWETQTSTNSSTRSLSYQDMKKESAAEAAKIEVIELKDEDESVNPSTTKVSVAVTASTEQPKETVQSRQAPSQPCLLNDTAHSLYTPAYSVIYDDWSDMLAMALTDPNLAPHYKTMIHCLVASNRDMKNIIVMMKSGQS
ncbi:unnamed protein product [Cylicocyclus nassatus]|uniref:Uncharacterized protein n=1 Tax=Cylicocyclus nassatus TaxID=53992 RepID=A0AA36GKI2_CYLNA|nr:unnamed protein product [Cylicocyclus nassatus]